MVVIQLLVTALLLGMDHVVQSRYGALGVLFLFLLGIGLRARNTACLSASAVVFFLLMTQA